jgi:hypothetical protein
VTHSGRPVTFIGSGESDYLTIYPAWDPNANRLWEFDF